MPARLYVGGLSYDVRERDLQDLFKKYGDIREVTIKSGFGFVVRFSPSFLTLFSH